MNIDIRLKLEFFDHPKTRKLRKRLGTEAVVCLIRLWMWTAGNRPGGRLTGLDAEAVELAAHWDGEDGALVAALCELRLLDERDGEFAVHDWETHQAYASKSEERSSKARRAAAARWGRSREVGDMAEPSVRGWRGVERDDARSMPAACERQCPGNREPETGNRERKTPPPVETGNTSTPRARADGGEGGGEAAAVSAVDSWTDSPADSSVGTCGNSSPADSSAGTCAVGTCGNSSAGSSAVGSCADSCADSSGGDASRAPLPVRARPRTDAPSKGTPEWTAFLSCWDVYPVKQGQEEAWREWERLRRNRTLEAAWVIREAILSMCAEDSRWRRGKVPKFARWLNGKGWNDTPFVEPGDACRVDSPVFGVSAFGGPAFDVSGSGASAFDVSGSDVRAPGLRAPGRAASGRAEPAAPTEYQRRLRDTRQLAAVLLAGRRPDAAPGGTPGTQSTTPGTSGTQPITQPITDAGTETGTGGLYETTALATTGGTLPALRTRPLA